MILGIIGIIVTLLLLAFLRFLGAKGCIKTGTIIDKFIK